MRQTASPPMINLPSDTQRLPKWPFLVGDAALLGVALTLALRNPAPLSPALIFAITGCVALAAILGAIPFLADYAAQQDEALDNRQRSLDALTRTVAGSAEQISAAAGGLHELSELARAQVEQAKALPEKLKTELETLQNERNENLIAENKNLQKELKSLKASESKKLTELTGKIQQAIEEIEKLKLAAPAPKKSRATKPKLVASEPESEPVAPLDDSTPKSATEPSSQKNEAAELETPAAETQPEAPQTESAPEPLADSPEPSPDETPKTAPVEPTVEEETPDEAAPTLSLDEPEAPRADHRISPDGVTRLLVSAYIGIGNRLFVRGTGAGLSEDKGVALQFVSIGKWQWETSDAASPLKMKLYKNDEIECTSLGEITIDPGSQSEVSATF
jgi:hypothetical protein